MRHPCHNLHYKCSVMLNVFHRLIPGIEKVKPKHALDGTSARFYAPICLCKSQFFALHFHGLQLLFRVVRARVSKTMTRASLFFFACAVVKKRVRGVCAREGHLAPRASACVSSLGPLPCVPRQLCSCTPAIFACTASSQDASK